MADKTSCAPTDRLLQTLKVHVPGATDPMIQLELFNVMDEFFRRTSAWRYANDIELLENTLEYDLAVPVDAVVVRAMNVGHNGIPVPAAGSTGSAVMTSLGRLAPELVFPDGDSTFDPDASDLSGGVFSYAIYRPDYITVTTPPDEEQRKYPLNVILALSLARSCLECDCGDWALEEWMYDMFFQDWLDGTLGRLYAMPAKPWTNKDQWVYHSKRFRNAMALRKQEANRGYSYARPARPMFPRGGWV
jgi:hypothetical protein